MKKDIDPYVTYGEIRRTQKKMEWELARGPEYWEYRRKWEERSKKMDPGDFPIHLDIETTNACNLRCPMCPRTIMALDKSGKVGFMDFELYKSIIDQGAENGLCSVKLNYLGEPLIHPDIIKQVKYAKEKGIIEVMFNTNAFLLTEEMSRKLLEAGLDSIFFSIDYASPEKYNRIRVGSDFHRVVNNIKKFIELKNKLGYRHVQTRISMVVMDHTKEELEDYRKFGFEELGVDLVGYGELVDYSEERAWYPEFFNPNFVCAQLFHRMFIMWDGVVTPCCADTKRESIMGDAKKEKLKDIWHNEKYRRMRDAHVSGKYYEIPICRKCYIPVSSLKKRGGEHQHTGHHSS
ncbi:MAG: radical SAM protein [Candidatus Hadarchaeales archaeon]